MMWAAVFGGSRPIVEEFLEREVEPRGSNALWLAVVRGRPDLTELLLAAGADPDGENDNDSLLHSAVQELSPFQSREEVEPSAIRDACRLLLNAGAEVDRRGYTGATPLMYAAGINATSFAQLFLDAGADPNIPDDQGATPLHEAARHLNLNLVTALLNAGAEVNARDDRNRTPLHWATAGIGRRPWASTWEPSDPPSAEPVIVILLEHGADPTIGHRRDKTPVDVAPREHRAFVLDLIERHAEP